MALDTPVGFLIFNRPGVTRRVFEAIAAARPRTLFIIADGPRSDHPEDAARCAEARKVVEEVTWDCTVLRDYADSNLGCGLREFSGMDWVFSQAEEAIFVEDDCLPSPSFFSFCHELLGRYRDDERVMVISGSNFQRRRRTPFSYYFSKYSPYWGWAGWRRAWRYYDYRMRLWPEFRSAGLLRAACPDPVERDYWETVFDDTHAGRVDTWDHQWTFACWAQGGLTVVPECNLVSNIGFGEGATHTTVMNPHLANVPAGELGPLSHPPFVVPHAAADAYLFDTVLGGSARRPHRTVRRVLGEAAREVLRLLFKARASRSN